VKVEKWRKKNKCFQILFFPLFLHLFLLVQIKKLIEEKPGQEKKFLDYEVFGGSLSAVTKAVLQ